MLERVCPSCGHGNVPDDVACSACGYAFASPLARRSQQALAQRWSQLPAPWQTAAKAAVLGIAALALEVGSTLLHDQAARPGTTLARSEPLVGKPRVVRRRVWRTYFNGQLHSETHEETQWFDR
ncbi:MAG: hypothetical protein NVS2B7_05940 [Herpetosiphon sp.]